MSNSAICATLPYTAEDPTAVMLEAIPFLPDTLDKRFLQVVLKFESLAVNTRLAYHGYLWEGLAQGDLDAIHGQWDGLRYSLRIELLNKYADQWSDYLSARGRSASWGTNFRSMLTPDGTPSAWEGPDFYVGFTSPKARTWIAASECDLLCALGDPHFENPGNAIWRLHVNGSRCRVTIFREEEQNKRRACSIRIEAVSDEVLELVRTYIHRFTS